MDLLLHFKVNEGDENNINIQEYMLYGVGLENRQTFARGDFAMDSYQESFENIYYGNSYEEEIWMDEYEKDAKTQELESNEMEL